MEQWLDKILQLSPALSIMVWLFWHQRKDYKELLNKTQDENAKREERYCNTIQSLTEKLNLIETVKDSVEEIKSKIL